jgi:cytosine/adenosine deaminase-related metal-dependent hydrolase
LLGPFNEWNRPNEKDWRPRFWTSYFLLLAFYFLFEIGGLVVMALQLRARWVFPVDRPPVAGGAVTIQDDRIVSVDDRPSSTDPVTDLGDVAILPGFVNAHTHLDLCGMLGKFPPSDNFAGWLRAVIDHRRSQSHAATIDAIHMGLADCRKFGTTTLGDISAGGMSWQCLTESPMWAVCFREALGLSRERARAAWETARDEYVSQAATERCWMGLSPHAPYSVRFSLFRRIGKLARRFPVPVAVHLAETPEEADLLRRHNGSFAAFLRDVGAWSPSGLCKSHDDVLTYLREIPNLLLVHCNYLSPSNAIPPGATVVYCPRTHAAFGHAPHPFRQFLAAGVRIALGTDSLASNPDLSVLAEAREVRIQHPDFPGNDLLRMATLSGAEGLGFAEHTGSLTPGKAADLVVLPVDTAVHGDPHELLWNSRRGLAGVMCGGTWLTQPSAGAPTAGT